MIKLNGKELALLKEETLKKDIILRDGVYDIHLENKEVVA